MVKSKIGIAGLGLIGGSLAIELSKTHTIIGKDTNSQSVDYCIKNGYINAVAEKFSDFIGCEIIFVCVPVNFVKDVCESVFLAVGMGSIITDVASVKGILEGSKGRIVGGHPMCGTEFCGITAAKPNLFKGAPYYLVKYSATCDEDFLKVKEIIQNELSSVVVAETFSSHDKIVSRTSHLPHMIAYTLASIACGSGKNAGNSLKDTTRIAASDPKFWTNVARLNKDNLLKDLDLYIDALTNVKTLIFNDDYTKLEKFLEKARESRINNN